MKAVNNQNVLKNAKGRPSKNNNEVKINELVVEYLTTKANNYGKSIQYYKITDSAFRSKFKPLFSLNDGDLKLPLWETENKDFIIKVGDQWNASLLEMIQGGCYVLDLEFKFYDLETNDGKNIKGYYAKIPSGKSLQSKIEVIPPCDDN